MNIIPFKSSGLSGDIIYSLPGIQHVCNQNKWKADYYIWLDRPFFLYDGARHPYRGMVPQYAFDRLKPLLEHQPYINKVKPWNGELVTIDIDIIRQRQINMPYGNLMRWPFYVFPDLACDLSKPWLKVDDIDESLTDKILINRTERYQNGWINYFFLQGYKDKLVFVGMYEEWEIFCKEWNLELPLLEVRDFYDLAVAINSCRFLIGNQSMCFAIAEGLKKPRILELFTAAQNVIPSGEHAYDFVVQQGLEYYVELLDKEL